jgi:hypothetical protein
VPVSSLMNIYSCQPATVSEAFYVRFTMDDDNYAMVNSTEPDGDHIPDTMNSICFLKDLARFAFTHSSEALCVVRHTS